MRVELETIGIAAVAHNHYITSRAGQRIPDIDSDLFVGIASCQETKSSIASTGIAPADLLPPEYRQ